MKARSQRRGKDASPKTVLFLIVQNTQWYQLRRPLDTGKEKSSQAPQGTLNKKRWSAPQNTHVQKQPPVGQMYCPNRGPLLQSKGPQIDYFSLAGPGGLHS